MITITMHWLSWALLAVLIAAIANAIMLGLQYIDGIDTTQEHVEETEKNRHVFDWVRLPDNPDA